MAMMESKYYVGACHDKAFQALLYAEATDDWNKVEDFVWEYVQKGFDCIIIDHETGSKKYAYVEDFNRNAVALKEIIKKMEGCKMYKEGTIIAVNGNLYEYGNVEDADFTKDLQLHKVYEIDIDEDGYLVNTGITNYFSTEELKNNEVKFTKQQWYGIVEHFLRYDYDLKEEEITDATEDIVGRCFAYGIPKFHELTDYIAEYMNR